MISFSPLVQRNVTWFVALVSVVLVAAIAVSALLTYRVQSGALLALQQQQASSTALQIEQFFGRLERQLQWVTEPGTGTTPDEGTETLYAGFLTVLRQEPVIQDVTQIGPAGRERLYVSRVELDEVDGGADRSRNAAFMAARSGQTYRGPVVFQNNKWPRMTLAIADGQGGIVSASLDLDLMWELGSTARAAARTTGHVIDAGGQLVSPAGARVQGEQNGDTPARDWSDTARDAPGVARNVFGKLVLVASAVAEPPGWLVVVERPLGHALDPVYALLRRLGAILVAAVVLSFGLALWLAARTIRPIRILRDGAERIGSGDLRHRIDIHSGDELETLADQFNQMAAQLHESYTTLEQRIEERTYQLEQANQAKSRFLAAASHDLRQPMHALGLFIDQLTNEVTEPGARKLVSQAVSSVDALRELLDALLDISKVEAGAMTPHPREVSVESLLLPMRHHFASTAKAKGISFRVAPSRMAVRTDPIMMERILINLVSNAVRHTDLGGVLVGCRRRGSHARFEVWDTGIGISPEHLDDIFRDFYQLQDSRADRGRGLGLGLAIVDRFARLLDHRIEVRSVEGKGSVFTIEAPAAADIRLTHDADAEAPGHRLEGARVLVVDDDELVREAMQGLLSSWGCDVVVLGSAGQALAFLDADTRAPDVLLFDYHLNEQKSGLDLAFDVRERLGRHIPAAIITGDPAPVIQHQVLKCGCPLLRKPVRPAKLRALLYHLLSHPVNPDCARAPLDPRDRA
ncbi:MAG: hybrid sensor histidine kinase/response regulator [Pseudomonadota bacterium]|nr:hybrid sensor histidine kinase/response regulator [Pseudomonadota bacterium]